MGILGCNISLNFFKMRESSINNKGNKIIKGVIGIGLQVQSHIFSFRVIFHFQTYLLLI